MEGGKKKKKDFLILWGFVIDYNLKLHRNRRAFKSKEVSCGICDGNLSMFSWFSIKDWESVAIQQVS